MNKDSFFKPTPLYKEFQLLSLIQNKSSVKQRELATSMGVSVAMVNHYLEEYENSGLLLRKYDSVKTVSYFITTKGESRRKALNLSYLESVLAVYNEAKTDCYRFFESIMEKGYKNILFYGAGEVAEILLTVINNDNKIDLNVLAIIDDDVEKQGKKLIKTPIISVNNLDFCHYDGVLISSYANSEIILQKMISLGIPSSRIIKFFD